MSDLFDMANLYTDANEAVQWNHMVNNGHTLPQPGMEGFDKKEFKNPPDLTTTKVRPKRRTNQGMYKGTSLL